MKILLIVSITVAITIHGSAGCCSSKNEINHELMDLFKKVTNRFDSVLENHGSCLCPKCTDPPGTGSPSGDTDGSAPNPPQGSTDSAGTVCPGLHPPIAIPPGACTKIPPLIDCGPDFTLRSPYKNYGYYTSANKIAASGYDLLWLIAKNQIRHYNRFKYCGLQEVERPSKAPLDDVRDIDISDGQIYIVGSKRINVWKKPIGSSDTKWTEFIRGSTSENIEPLILKWSKDGEKLFILSKGDSVYVYNKTGGQIDTFKSCYHGNVISFDMDNNIQMATIEHVICLYNYTDHKLIKRIAVPSNGDPNGILGLYTHCDGTMIASDGGGRLIFMDKNYKLTGIVRNLSDEPGVYNDLAVTSDGYLHVTVMQFALLHKYKLF